MEVLNGSDVGQNSGCGEAQGQTESFLILFEKTSLADND